MADTLYSFIIPHKNSPELLNRMIASIPQREDVEIVVVDDNSDESRKPRELRADVRVVHVDAEHSKGAGRARNIGLQNVSGKWLLFPDADDEYYPDFTNVLDKYSDSDYEVVYFNSSVVDNTTNIVRERSHEWNQNYEKANESRGHLIHVKYFRAPWAKMVSKDFVRKYGLKYQECPNGNDAMFSFHVAALSKHVYVEASPLYKYYLNPNSITRKHRTNVQIKENIKNLYKKRFFLEKVSYPYDKPSLYKLLSFTYSSKGLKDFLSVLRIFVDNYIEIKRDKTEYWDLIKTKL